MSHERFQAIGKLEQYKRELARIGISVGSHLETLRNKTNSIFVDDFLDMDLSAARELIDDLVSLQKKLKSLNSKILEIQTTYGLEVEDD